MPSCAKRCSRAIHRTSAARVTFVDCRPRRGRPALHVPHAAEACAEDDRRASSPRSRRRIRARALAVLLRRDLSWELRIVTFTGNDQLYCAHRWNDYSASDVVVALRPPSTWNLTTKPAAKLTNAWAAGVPAIVSPEPPYRELRQSRLDYLEARSAADALDAIDRLRSDPRLYSAMVENGLARAREFHATRLTSCWAEALWQTVPARTSGAGYRLTARLRGYRALARQVRRRLRTLHPARSSPVDPAAG